MFREQRDNEWKGIPIYQDQDPEQPNRTNEGHKKPVYYALSTLLLSSNL